MKIGFCICGSFCMHKKALCAMERLALKYELVPVLADSRGILGVGGIGVNLDRAARSGERDEQYPRRLHNRYLAGHALPACVEFDENDEADAL